VSGRRTTRPPDLDPRFAVPLRGVEVDVQTRCAHYAGSTDVVALRCGCCATYHPCHRCHAEVTGREGVPWPRARFDEPAVLCGVCRAALTARAYLGSGHACPACGAAFNPGCAAHRGLYFEAERPAADR
jgi:uncharacterized CHY-type Zn-finger protein